MLRVATFLPPLVVAACCLAVGACQTTPAGSAPEWTNWTRELRHGPATNGDEYYFMPATREELQLIVEHAREAGVDLRVSGQRHSQPPLVVHDNRLFLPPEPTTFLVDLSCYADLGEDGSERMVIHASPDGTTVEVNAGVREDELDAFLTKNDLMLPTVTAGGFFSIGGMTAVDVHGATIDAPIFAETATAFTVMGPDGGVTTIDASTPAGEGWSALQFARVSLGALGVVTSVVLEVEARPWATTLELQQGPFDAATEAAFVQQMKARLAKSTRIEVFYNPYRDGFHALLWDVDDDPFPIKNRERDVASACTFAEQQSWGAPYVGVSEDFAAQGIEVQLGGKPLIGQSWIDVAMLTTSAEFAKAQLLFSDLWLTRAARVAFMSYFFELPRLDDARLRKVWKILRVVGDRLEGSEEFVLAGPLEFRFVRGGDSALSGTWSTDPEAVFVNVDLIFFVDQGQAADYPQALLDFLGHVERCWYGDLDLAGMPHNSKMYGFHEPDADSGGTPPFADAFMSHLAARRGARRIAFEAYRQTRDAQGLFCNEFLASSGLCTQADAGRP